MTNRLAKLCISLIYYFCYRCNVVIFNALKMQHPGTFVVLNYHEITSRQRNNFVKQIDKLVKTANPITADNSAHLKRGLHNVVVTFDDGFQNVIENALPKLFECKVPFTMFIPLGYLGRYPGWIIERYDKNHNEKIMTAHQLKTLPLVLITIGSHCITHSKLTLFDEKTVREELVESKKRLEEILEREVDLLAFPYNEYNQKIVKWAKEAGYKRVFAGQSVSPLFKEDEFLSGRISTSPDDWPLEFFLKIMGAYQWLPLAVNFKTRLRAIIHYLMRAVSWRLRFSIKR